MTHQEDIAALKRRLAKAESDRDAWKAAGPPEKYLEAYFTVEALELQAARAPNRLHDAVTRASTRSAHN